MQKKFCFKEKGGENFEEPTKKMLKRNCNMVTLTANQMVLAQTQEDCCFTKNIFMRHASLGPVVVQAGIKTSLDCKLFFTVQKIFLSSLDV